ncbi:hypothetical protein [Ideonella sp.]|uniref:hypothetical protein n=1 Tax=Ideonella sp. TaxID=1929293 RepID=UPI002B467D98|nr:hypothetical protein [Ideonella sp.]HJV70111.1 hypothetical protein [Ideonella sp.]
MNKTLLTFSLAALGAAAAHAELVDIAWSADQRFERSFAVAPAKFAEVCGKLAKGESIAWRFEADQPLNFNIHYHVGKAVEYPAKQDGAKSADGTLAVALDQDYCWMWTNRSGAPATLKLTLSK